MGVRSGVRTTLRHRDPVIQARAHRVRKHQPLINRQQTKLAYPAVALEYLPVGENLEISRSLLGFPSVVGRCASARASVILALLLACIVGVGVVPTSCTRPIPAPVRAILLRAMLPGELLATVVADVHVLAVRNALQATHLTAGRAVADFEPLTVEGAAAVPALASGLLDGLAGMKPVPVRALDGAELGSRVAVPDGIAAHLTRPLLIEFGLCLLRLRLFGAASIPPSGLRAFGATELRVATQARQRRSTPRACTLGHVDSNQSAPAGQVFEHLSGPSFHCPM